MRRRKSRRVLRRVLYTDPEERGDAISIASIFKAIGQSGGMAVLPAVGFAMKAIMGKQQYKTAEGQGLDLVISTAVCALGCVLFTMIFFPNNRERVPYTEEKVSLKESLKFVFTNKNLLMVSLTKFTRFRQRRIQHRKPLHSSLPARLKGPQNSTFVAYGHRHGGRHAYS